jgi:hypothetical protein
MISNTVQNRFNISRHLAEGDTNVSTIIPSASKVQTGQITSLSYNGRDSTSLLTIYPFHSALKTTLIAGDDGIAGGIGAFNLTADTATTDDKLNGVVVAVDDHVLIALEDGSWQLFTIGSMDEGTSGVIAITGMTPFDADNNLRSKALNGATAYVLLAEHVMVRAGGDGYQTVDVPIACGEQGVPFALSLSSGADNAKDISGIVEYTESRRITAPMTQY